MAAFVFGMIGIGAGFLLGAIWLGTSLLFGFIPPTEDQFAGLMMLMPAIGVAVGAVLSVVFS